MPTTFDALTAEDPQVAELCRAEARRQADTIRLIPSENYVSTAVLEASSSVFTNKYSEGYPGKRYYEGQQFVDPLEQLAIDRAKSLFGAQHANVQPYSGSPANLAAYLAFLKPGDKVMGLALPMGGHLTHGWSVSISGKFFTSVPYGIRKDTGRLDYDEIRDLAKRERPALLWAGGSAYSRLWDFEIMASIARDVGARFCADIAHIAGLIAGGVHPSAVPHADVVTTTTHKTLRGPRGGMILCKAEFAQAIDKAVFPGVQGGPHVHTIAALAVALKEAAQPSFKDYAKLVVANARVIAAELMAKGYDVVSGGTDNHLILIDLTNKNVSGKIAARALDRAGIELNYNAVPYDTRKPFDPSGIRLGSPSISSCGMGAPEMKQIAAWMDQVISNPTEDNADKIRPQVRELCAKFPAPGISA
ncbi:MAG TPA: serine hydroxymethyltransferase [Polyangia bacterium]|jgi:glycine hydroxymethyltransferase|nr:serine hydroxymethyltransferase [Polyangia bacterium]